jgi:hypothetical protein
MDDDWKSVKPRVYENKVNYLVVIGNQGLGSSTDSTNAANGAG